MTLEGTNTWIVGDPGEAPPIVVDPGPLHEGHLRAVLEACGGRIGTIVLTHRHPDHSDGVARLAELAGCDARAADPRFQIGSRPLADGDLLVAGGTALTAVATPGHTDDSYSLLLQGPDGVARLLTGDMVLGRGTTVITHPGGNLACYLASVELMRRLVVDKDVTEILPGHGPVVRRPAELLDFYRRHRLERLEQVRAALAAGDRTAAEVVARVYADVDHSLWPAAEQSVMAQLKYLAEDP
nr:MBL fold metallo-hydrolase [Microlunatus panaciterrae]